jgi:hypothetical protein
MNLNSFGSIRHYGLARYAFLEALKICNIGHNKKILVPSFICSDVLAPIYLSGATHSYYDVDLDLAPAGEPEEWLKADAILMVNYFGFPQNLNKFQRYSELTGAIVIEDNAHGFLSRDASGLWLGTRSSVGIFSYRKTLLVGSGAFLAVNNALLKNRLSSQIDFVYSLPPIQITLRILLRFIFKSRTPEYYFFTLKRLVRSKLGFSSIPQQNSNAETSIPDMLSPSYFSMRCINQLDEENEKNRRIKLYKRLSKHAKDFKLRLVFPILTDNIVPYGLPVYSIDGLDVEAFAKRHKIDYFRWPDLPKEVLRNAPEHYKNLYILNFL